MKTITLTTILTVVSITTHAAILTSTFDSGAEGWGGVRLPNTVTFTSILEGPFTPTYRPTTGNPAGSISITDINTIPSLFWFSAPSPFLGNQSDRYGGTIRWDHRYTYAEPPEPPNLTLPDIALIGAGRVLVGDAGPPSSLSNVWHSFSISLRETTGWHVGNLTNPAPTEAEFRAVLADLQILYVLGEYIGNMDTGYIDNFQMTDGDCPLATIRLSEVEVCWRSQSNRQYRVDYRSAFETTNAWVPFPTNTFFGDGGVMCIYDKIPPGRPQRFYRVVCAP